MLNTLKKTTVALAATTLLAGPAFAADEVIKEVTVLSDYTDLEGANAKMYYPEISQDLMTAIAERLEMTDDPMGYVVTVNVQSVTLDGDTVLPDTMEFNELSGVVSLLAPQSNAQAESYPITVRAESLEEALPSNVVAADPGVDTFYTAMIDGFADSVIDVLPENLRQSGSK